MKNCALKIVEGVRALYGHNSFYLLLVRRYGTLHYLIPPHVPPRPPAPLYCCFFFCVAYTSIKQLPVLFFPRQKIILKLTRVDPLSPPTSLAKLGKGTLAGSAE